MSSKVDIQWIVDAFEQYQEAKKEHDAARESCEYSWGYHGYSLITALESAEQELAKRVDDYIDSRIEAKLDGFADYLRNQQMNSK